MPRKDLPIGVNPIDGGNVGRFVLAIGLVAMQNFGTAAEIRGMEAQNPSGQSPPTANSPLEQFKAFISSPPIISNLVFQQKIPMSSGARPLDGSFARSTRFEYFQARRQSDGLLFRQINSPSDVTNFTVSGYLMSTSEHRHALLEPNQLLTTWDDRDPSVAGKAVSVFYTSHFFQKPLREILNLGIMHTEIGTIRWNGNRFSAVNQIDQEHVRISGELHTTGSAPPASLMVRYEFPHDEFDYVIRYGYAPQSRYSFLPVSNTVTAPGVGTGRVGTTGTSTPAYCTGPAQFQDRTGHTDTVPYWQNALLGGSPFVPNSGSIPSGGAWGTPTGSTCM